MKQTDIVRIRQYDFGLMLSSSAIQQRVSELGAQITADYTGSDPPLFIVVLKGAFVFAADLMRAVDLPTSITFVQLSSYEGMQSGGTVRSLLNLDSDEIKNRHLIIIEDIVDTGNTLQYFLRDLQRWEPASVKIAALLLKPQNLQHAIKVDYTGFEIPPAFVVGYGLDYDEEGRQLPAIYQKQ